ncbi:hypothetical protein SELMODRAFT_230472 [Selaginella moellendorffii]|uniref:Peroxidase n=1 Tax=Selaginella moellendorffii TaxID=88036 RepID=D8R1N7_SELML|nr:hypothetical protein SELMODRAFT_230472 [Selaginella moellendorffii]
MKRSSALLSIFLAVAPVLIVAEIAIFPRLATDFYVRSCPELPSIVRRVIAAKFAQTPVAAAGMLRIFFHDCMVEGCDASVLVASTPSNKAEKDAEINLSLPGDGFDAVIKAKAAVESKCPGVVSCADILALSTRELVVLIGGPSWEVRLGRRDGTVSKASRVPGNLPMPNMTVAELTSLFASKGLSLQDMVALTGGGHTAGFAHCNQFMDRIYGTIDPTMNPSYAAELRQACPRGPTLDPTVVTHLDPSTPDLFDNAFFKNTLYGRGLLRSDQALFSTSNSSARPLVNLFAGSQPRFFEAFGVAMDKLGGIGVKTGGQGEIRRDCAAFNHA